MYVLRHEVPLPSHPHPPISPSPPPTHLSVLLIYLAAIRTPELDAKEGLPVLSSPPLLVGEGRLGGVQKAATDDERPGR